MKREYELYSLIVDEWDSFSNMVESEILNKQNKIEDMKIDIYDYPSLKDAWEAFCEKENFESNYFIPADGVIKAFCQMHIDSLDYFKKKIFWVYMPCIRGRGLDEDEDGYDSIPDLEIIRNDLIDELFNDMISNAVSYYDEYMSIRW